MMKNKATKSLALVAAGIAAGFIGRWLLDSLMSFYPKWSSAIDIAGQGVIGLAISWYCIVPILEMYGVIKSGQSREV